MVQDPGGRGSACSRSRVVRCPERRSEATIGDWSNGRMVDGPGDEGRDLTPGALYSLAIASITSAAWPAALTFENTRAMSPLASMRKVVRSTPMYFRPYIDFSFQTSYSLATSFSVSASS